jgi:hypothetical protein
MAVIHRTDAAAPNPESGEMGVLRSAVLEAHLLDRPAEVPAAIADALEAWAAEVLHDVRGAPRGVSLEGIDEGWLSTLSWAGVPFARGGELKWQRDIRVDEQAQSPRIEGDQLVLPSPEHLAECSGLGIKPVRTWIQNRLGVRLQAAPGLRLYVWPSHGMVISHLNLTVGGFLYGPGFGTRMGLTIHPGTWQMVPW